MLALIAALTLVGAVPVAQATLPPLPPLKGMSTATPTPAPLKEIARVRSSSLCGGFKRVIAPAVGHILEGDKLIATSKPLFNDYAYKNHSGMSQAALDIDVVRLEGLILPLNRNIEAAEKLLNDATAFPKHPMTQADKDLVAIRDGLRASIARQKNALDVISGFVDTQQLGELQAAGHDYDNAISGSETRNAGSSNNPGPVPTASPDALLNAGVGGTNSKDPVRQNDPLYKPSSTLFGHDVYNAFAEAIGEYQHEIDRHETVASQLILKNVPSCGGKVPSKP